MSGRAELCLCPQCGMDSGTRKIKETIPIKYFVVCDHCGFRTKGFDTQAGATRNWNYMGADQ